MPVLGLFTSLGTLVCCALPALFVTLGMGAALVGLVSAAPWMVTLSEHKAPVFGVAGVVLTTALFLQWRGRGAPCPSDPAKARACARLRKFSLVVSGVAVTLYLVGFFFAFVAVHVFF